MADDPATVAPEGGYWYQVSDEQRRVFSSLTPEQRLQWLEEMREFTWATAPVPAKASWERLRRAKGGSRAR